MVCSGALSLWFAATVLITLFNRYEQVAAKIPFAPIGDVFFCIIVFAFIWAIVVLIIKYFQRFIFWCEKKSRQKPRNNALCQLIAKIDLEFNRKSVLVAALVIVIFWTPWIVLSYPTVVAYDTMNQIYQFQTSAPTYYSTTQVFVDAEYIDHHPVFLSLVYGSVLWVGDRPR